LKWRFFLFLFLFFLPWEVCAQISVSFQANASVAGPRIVLGDIAVIKPAGEEAKVIGQLPVAAAPAPGKSKELYTVSVINSLRNRPEVTGVDWQGSQTIMVQRKGNRVPPEQLQAIVDQFLKESGSQFPNAELRFSSFRAPGELTLPAGKLSWKVTPSRPGILGSTSFSIAIAVDGQPAATCVVRGRLEVLAEVAVAAAALHKGDVIADNSVSMQKQDVSNLQKPFTAKEQLLGMEMARTVNAGTVLEQTHIASPPVIRGGEMVKIVARKGALQLSTSGLAKTDGRLGETIPVKNISSNKMIHGRVDGPGVVSVEF